MMRDRFLSRLLLHATCLSNQNIKFLAEKAHNEGKNGKIIHPKIKNTFLHSAMFEMGMNEIEIILRCIRSTRCPGANCVKC